MFTMVIGASASGKSEFGENLLLQYGPAPRFYIATMEPFGREARERIRRHHALRSAKGFSTIEQYVSLPSLTLPQRGNALLECMGNLCANELFSPQGAGDRESACLSILNGIQSLRQQCDHLVVVTNEVFSDGIQYAEETHQYLQLLSRVNNTLAQWADQVYEVHCGQARAYKEG